MVTDPLKKIVTGPPTELQKGLGSRSGRAWVCRIAKDGSRPACSVGIGN
jgi:hypothetical protein